MTYSRLVMLFLFTLTGCSANPHCETIGLRVFNENPRHFTSDEKIERIWIDLRAKDTGETICRAIIPDGFHAPMEVYFIPKNQSGLIFMMEYDGIDQETGKYAEIDFEQVIPGDRDLEVRIRWVPFASPEAPLAEQLKRKPKLEISYGHTPWF